VGVRVPAMVQRYNKYIKRTYLFDQKLTVYPLDRKSPGKYYCRPFWDYSHMEQANSLIVCEKVVSKFPDGSK